MVPFDRYNAKDGRITVQFGSRLKTRHFGGHFVLSDPMLQSRLNHDVTQRVQETEKMTNEVQKVTQMVQEKEKVTQMVQEKKK